MPEHQHSRTSLSSAPTHWSPFQLKAKTKKVNNSPWTSHKLNWSKSESSYHSSTRSRCQNPKNNLLTTFCHSTSSAMATRSPTKNPTFRLFPEHTRPTSTTLKARITSFTWSHPTSNICLTSWNKDKKSKRSFGHVNRVVLKPRWSTSWPTFPGKSSWQNAKRSTTRLSPSSKP